MNNKQFKLKLLSVGLGISLVVNGVFLSSVILDLDLPMFNKVLVDEKTYSNYKVFKKTAILKSEIDEKYY